jgi:hypothetical protein
MSYHKALLLRRSAAPDASDALDAPDAPDALDVADLYDLADRPALLGPIPLIADGHLVGLAEHLAAADAWLARWEAKLDAPRTTTPAACHAVAAWPRECA